MGQKALQLEARLRGLCWARDERFVAEVLDETEASVDRLQASAAGVMDEAWEARTDPAVRRRLEGLAARRWTRVGRSDLAERAADRATR